MGLVRWGTYTVRWDEWEIGISDIKRERVGGKSQRKSTINPPKKI